MESCSVILSQFDELKPPKVSTHSSKFVHMTNVAILYLNLLSGHLESLNEIIVRFLGNARENVIHFSDLGTEMFVPGKATLVFQLADNCLQPQILQFILC